MMTSQSNLILNILSIENVKSLEFRTNDSSGLLVNVEIGHIHSLTILDGCVLMIKFDNGELRLDFPEILLEKLVVNDNE